MPTVLLYVALIAVFGVLLPWTKGLDFLDPVMTSAYACLGVLFAGPATAEAFAEKRPDSLKAALRRVAKAVIYGEALALAMLIAGVATVGVLYVLVNAGVQYVLPASVIAASPRPASDAVALVMGHMGAAIVSVGMAISMLVTLNGTIMSGARVPYAVARDGYFFRALAEVHPRFHTPSAAIVVQAVLSIILLLLGGNFRQLFSLAIFAEWLFYMIAGSTVFVLRWREPQAVRPYRVLGYPFVPAAFIVVAAVLLSYTFRGDWPNSFYGLLVILAGVPVFWWFRGRRERINPD